VHPRLKLALEEPTSASASVLHRFENSEDIYEIQGGIAWNNIVKTAESWSGGEKMQSNCEDYCNVLTETAVVGL